MKEIFDIKDSQLKGFVIIKDKNGKTIVEKHNMIVKEGKDSLLYYLLNGITNIPLDSLPQNYKLKKIYLYESNNAVSYNDNMDIINNNDPWDPFDLDNTNTFLEETSDGHQQIKISITKAYSDFYKSGEAPTSNSKFLINSISLILENESSMEKMFSRIHFDPIIMTPESSLNLTYYVYF